MPTTGSLTILFTDLVGSTELAYSLSPHAADELRRSHFACLRDALAGSGGTEVKNLGDGMMVTFPASSTAVACAVAMQQAVEAQNRRSAQHLGLRIGIAGGEVAWEGDDYFGEPVIEASRLCARAQGGQILATYLVRVMAGRRSPHSFSALGELDVAGIAGPVEVLQVEWEPLSEVASAPGAAERIPMPRRLSHRPTIGFIGRELQLSTLEDAYKRVAHREGREVVLIGGEAGQGKTTLASELARRAHAEGAVSLLGRCDEELRLPYAPFAEALQHYVSHAPDSVVQAHVAQHGAELSRLVKALRSRVKGLAAPAEPDAETERYLLYAAVLGLLAQATSDHPVVLVLDDLQWADAASLQLLRHLVREADPLRLLIVGTYRDTELTANHPLTETLGALRREAGVSRISLRGLEDGEVVRYVEAAAGHELTRSGVELAHAVYGETDGNPFFVDEVLKHLADEGAISRDERGQWRTDGLQSIELPESVREVVHARTARLGEPAVQILSMAAVIGRDFDLAHLSTTCRRDEDGLLDLLEAADRAALVHEVPEVPGRYSFSHALVRHTLYQELGATRRARAHQQVAQALEELCGDHPEERIGELAYHWFHATQQVDVHKAVSYSRRAGAAAMAALAPADAVRYFLQALQLLEQVPDADAAELMEVRLDLGIAQRQAGFPGFRETLLAVAQRALESGDRGSLVRAALANNRGFYSALGRIDRDKVSVLESALRTVEGGDGAERAVLLATLCSELAYGPIERRLELARESREMAERVDDPTTSVDVLNLLQLPLDIPDTLPERREASRRASRLAKALGDPVRQFWAVHSDRNNAVQSGDFERASADLSTMQELSQHLREPMMVWVTAYHQAAESLIRGDHERAEQLATAAWHLGQESSQPDAYAFYAAQTLVVRMQQGRLHEMSSLLTQIVEENPRIASYRACLAASHLHGDEMDPSGEERARELLARAVADGFDRVLADSARFDAISVYAEVAAELEDADAARLLAEFIAPYAEQVPFQGITVHEPMSCYLGQLLSLLGRYEEAESNFRGAMALANHGRMRHAEAQIRLAWGRTLAARAEGDDLSRARELLTEAEIGARSGSFGAIERRARAALGRLR